MGEQSIDKKAAQYKAENPVIQKLETLLKASFSKEEINELAIFIDSVEFGIYDVVTSLNMKLNPQTYR